MYPVYTALLFGVISLMLYYVIKVLTAKTADQRHKYLDEEEAVATAAATIMPLI